MLRTILASLLLTACGTDALVTEVDPPGGERPAPTRHPDSELYPNAAPRVTIVFPPPASATTATSMIVRGVATDGDGVAEVRINGVLATSDDEFATWRVEVPLVAGANELVATATDGIGTRAGRAAVAAVKVRDEFPQAGGHLAIDATSAYTIDFDGRVIATDRATGARSVIPGLDLLQTVTPVRSVAIDRVRGELLVAAHRRGVVGFDLATHAKRTVVSESEDLGAIAFDQPANVLYAVDSSQNLVAFDLATNTRTLISGPTRGSGQALLPIWSLELDRTHGRVLVVHGSLFSFASFAVLAIDLATGDRTVLSGEGAGTGPLFHGPSRLTIDEANNRVFVGQSGNGLYEIDLATGNRETVPVDSSPGDIAFDPATGELLMNDLLGIQRLDLTTGTVGSLVDPDLGTGPGLSASQAMVATETGVIVANDTGGPDQLISVDLATRQRQIRGDGFAATELDPERLLVARSDGIFDFELATGTTHKRSDLSGQAVAVGPSGDRAYVLTLFAARIFEVDLATGSFEPLFAIGSSDGATNGQLAMDAARGQLLFTNGQTVRALDLEDREVATLATLEDPLAIAVDGDRALVGSGRSLLGLDLTAHTVSRIDTSGPDLGSVQAIAVTSGDRAFAMTGLGLQLVDLQTGHHVLVGGR